MLKKKKQETTAQFQTLDDSRVPAYDFRLRISKLFESYRTAEYRPYEPLSEETMRVELDGYLDKLFDGEVDDGNGDVLLNLIFSRAREALPLLRIQRVNHEDMLQRLTIRYKADKKDFEQLLEDAVRERITAEQAYEKAIALSEQRKG